MHVHRRVRLGLHPAAKHAAARKDKRVLAAGVDHRQFEVAIKWCACYGPPFHGETIGQSVAFGFDPHQSLALISRVHLGSRVVAEVVERFLRDFEVWHQFLSGCPVRRVGNTVELRSKTTEPDPSICRLGSRQRFI